jgi:hypothetical protein
MEDKNILKLPSVEYFGEWEDLQYYLEKKGNPLYSIEGDLYLPNAPIQSLGNLTSVKGNLYLFNTPTQSLGNLTSVGGSLYLFECEHLTSLEKLTSVGGNLNLKYCYNLTSLGDLVSVGGDLDLEKTPISRKCSEEEIRQMVDVKGHIYYF